MRVYEIAREVGIPNKELITKIRALGLEVNNHMSSLELDDVARVKRSLEKDRIDNTVTKRLSKTVLRRRTKGSDGPDRIEVTTAPEHARAEIADAVEAATAAPRPKKVAVRKTAKAAPAAAEVVASKPVQAQPEVQPEAPAPKKRKAKEAPTPAVEKPEEAAPVKASPEPKPKAPEPPQEIVAAPSEPPAEPAPAPAASKPTPVIIEGPAIVDLPGRKKAPAPAAAKPVEASPAATPEPKKPAPAAEPPAEAEGPKTLEEVAGSAHARFQAELDRARRQAEQREKQRAQEVKVAEADAEAPPAAEEEAQRPAGRPEVGSIIDLPMTRIKITERGPSGRAMPGQGQVRGRFAQQQTRGRRPGRVVRKKQKQKGIGKQTQITTPAEHKRVIRIEETTSVTDLGKAMGIKAQELLKKLWGLGMVGVNINAAIDFETAQLLASEFGYDVQNVAFKEEDVFETKEDTDEQLTSRAPVVTVMGHVDHGKTSLLDYIRQTRIAAGESGGITQHIGAYKVRAAGSTDDIVFIDTPGHAAFTEMRARGAQSTDIVILVCAADDGVMPQTVEAVNHAKDAKVGIIVAVNKCDLPNANPERVRQQLADLGLIPEEWGGETLYVDVSAHTGDGVDQLLESVTLTAELLELKANAVKSAIGVVIEAKLDRARGSMATLLVQSGTLRIGDIVVVGECTWVESPGR